MEVTAEAFKICYIDCMIKTIRVGQYSLLETVRDTKLLILDQKDTFAWITAQNIGELLVVTHKPHKTDYILAVGEYRMYDISGEPKFTDLAHLELQVGNNEWQGYLLPTGLPTDKKSEVELFLQRSW